MKPTFLQTNRKESFSTWKFRTKMNWYPMYFGSGGKILFWDAQSRELHVQIKLSIWSYNYVGTIFGGSMFSATDPFYMLMLLRILGTDYVVWDKSANIKFIRPARTTLFAKYLISDELLDDIKSDVAANNECTRVLKLELKDANEKVHAVIERVVYVADKKYYEEKKGVTQTAKLGR